MKRLNPLPHQLLFVDETSKDIRDLARLYGRGAAGQRVYSPYPGRRDRYSACVGLSVTGYVGWGVTQGTYDTEAFLSVMFNTIIPQMKPYPGSRSVLVLDGAVIHKNEELVAAVVNRGCFIVYLPPYSPEFNPIEMTFQLLKAWLKRHQMEWLIDSRQCLERGLAECLTNPGDDLYSSCGYNKDGVEEWYQPIDQYYEQA